MSTVSEQQCLSLFRCAIYRNPVTTFAVTPLLRLSQLRCDFDSCLEES
ncbi:MAG: hypothetical protein HXN93_02955 [Prevotella pleuritidis]|nr:hypothetical protein [Hoylesella pleuritidis]